MKAEQIVQTTYLKDYRLPDFLVESIDLHFELGEEKTVVHSHLKINRNQRQGKHQRPVILNGEQLKLISLHVNDKPLLPHQYQITVDELIINDVPDSFTLEMVTEIYPQKNTALSGLYRSGNMFCTQCEAQGFRRITYHFDRPDVMSTFTTTIVADKTKYPILLSNGNKIASGEMSDNRHWVKWHDPFKKPCYLFALVAGPLKMVKDTFQTASGKNVSLEFFVEPENIDKCEHAIRSLKNAMRWDEQVYGREYDLDVYMVVAVNDFNMGAMENKGLNIFNSKYVLANEKTATDYDFQAVESVIGHEYFHNWTGNRVTCRDWFQLSLKEGLTVFREQQFSATMGSAAVKRINDVKVIRTRQFAEDAGPMAHPVRPDSYIEINNFYTTTIYYKGAEVIRMLHTLLGEHKFRKGMDLYFERHDGHAVTIEDFVAAMADANDVDLNQFHRWYSQAGTPVVKVEADYRLQTKQYVLTFKQSCPMTPDKKEKLPYMIPIKLALFDENGNELKLTSNRPLSQTPTGQYVILTQPEEVYTFDNITAAPTPSLLGDFSAPVKLHFPYAEKQLIMLMTHDNDLFNRWDAAQRLSLLAIEALMKAHLANKALTPSKSLIAAFQELLAQPIHDPHLLAQILVIPSFNYIAEELPTIEVNALVNARKALIQTLAHDLHKNFIKLYEACLKADDGRLAAKSIGYRALKNVALAYLMRTEAPLAFQFAEDQYKQAKNMTDAMGALTAINLTAKPIRDSLFNDFYVKWKHDPLVVNKWLMLHATCELPHTLESIKRITQHEAFDIGNPNKVYALINGFASSNPERFHDDKGEGYMFVADKVIELNQRNPQVAARILESLTQWKRLDEMHGNLMKQALQKIKDSGKLSEDVYEIITKSLLN